MPSQAEASQSVHPSALLAREDVLRYLAHEASARATTTLQSTNNQWRVVWTSLIAVLGFLGYRNMTEVIAGPVKSDLERTLEESGQAVSAKVEAFKLAVDERLEQANLKFEGLLSAERRVIDELIREREEELRASLAELDREMQTGLALVALQKLALEIQENDGVRTTEADVVLEQLSKIVLSDEVRGSAEFVAALQSVVRSFAAADLAREIDRIADMADEMAQEDAQLSVLLMEHYGERLVGSLLGPQRWSEQDVAYFERYRTAVEHNNFVERALVQQSFVEFLRAGSASTDGLHQLIDAVRYLRPEEQAAFHVQLIQYTKSEHWTRRPTAQSERIAKVARAYVAAHLSQLDGLLEDAPELREAMAERADTLPPQGRALSKSVKAVMSKGYGSLNP